MTSLPSITSSIAFAAAKGNEAYFQLNELISGANSVPSDIRGLEQEIQELCRILGELERTFEHHDEPSTDLKTVIENCTDCFSELGSLVRDYWVKKGDGKLLQRFKSLRWALQEKQVATLRKQLEVQRATLSTILRMLVNAHGASVKDIRDLAQKKESNYTFLGYVSIPTSHLLGRSQGSGDIALAYDSTPRGPIPNSSSKDISSRGHEVGASNCPSKSVAHVTETRLFRPCSPRPRRPVNYGNLIQVRREMRTVCRRSSKEKGCTHLI